MRNSQAEHFELEARLETNRVLRALTTVRQWRSSERISGAWLDSAKHHARMAWRNAQMALVEIEGERHVA